MMLLLMLMFWCYFVAVNVDVLVLFCCWDVKL